MISSGYRGVGYHPSNLPRLFLSGVPVLRGFYLAIRFFQFDLSTGTPCFYFIPETTGILVLYPKGTWGSLISGSMSMKNGDVLNISSGLTTRGRFLWFWSSGFAQFSVRATIFERWFPTSGFGRSTARALFSPAQMRQLFDRE